MRRPRFRLGIRHLLIGVAIAAVGLSLLRATRERELEFVIRRDPAGGWPWERRAAVRVRLDPDRMRARHLSRDDVMRAFQETRMIDPAERAATPPGVVVDARLRRPDEYGNLILFVVPEGNVVRVKDVATVEADR